MDTPFCFSSITLSDETEDTTPSINRYTLHERIAFLRIELSEIKISPTYIEGRLANHHIRQAHQLLGVAKRVTHGKQDWNTPLAIWQTRRELAPIDPPDTGHAEAGDDSASTYFEQHSSLQGLMPRLDTIRMELPEHTNRAIAYEAVLSASLQIYLAMDQIGMLLGSRQSSLHQTQP